MSQKFEQLLDYLVNEEMDKANELFHEIVVEKSREIYENLISEEHDEEDDEMDEGRVEDDEEMDEAVDDEEMDEAADEELEDSYMMDGDSDDGMDGMDDKVGGDATDDMLKDIDVDHEEGGEDEAMMDIKNAIAELEAAFAELEAAQGGEVAGDEFGDKFGDEDDKDADEMMGMVREYREPVAKPSGEVAGANTGDKMGSAGATKSPVSSAKGKPTSGATAQNIAGKSDTANEDGTKPHGKVGGLVKQGGKFVGNNTLNVDNAQTGVKKLSKVSKPADAEGHAAGAGTGDNSVKGATNTKSVVDHKLD